MKTSVEVEGLLAGPQPAPAAANEEFASSPQSPLGGWDPFEVWRTRVKAEAQESPDPGVIPG